MQASRPLNTASASAPPRRSRQCRVGPGEVGRQGAELALAGFPAAAADGWPAPGGAGTGEQGEGAGLQLRVQLGEVVLAESEGRYMAVLLAQ